MNRPKSLRSRLSLSLLGALTVVLTCGGWLIDKRVFDSLYAQFDAALLTKARIVMTNAQQQHGDIRVYFSDAYLREFDDAIASEFFQVWTVDGLSVERSDSLEADNLPIRSAGLDLPVYWNLQLPNGGDGRAIGIRFIPRVANSDPGDLPREAIVVVASDRETLKRTLQAIRATLILVGGLLLGVLYALVPIIVRSLLHPIQKVANQSIQFKKLSSAQRFPTVGLPSELVPICNQLNSFMERLETAFHRERQFSSDIAHELRTPLSEIRSTLEVALRWPEDDPQEQMRKLLEITSEMERIIEQLLQIARSEKGKVGMQKASVRLDVFIKKIIKRNRPEILSRNLLLNEQMVETEIQSDPALLGSILQNTIQNAIRHAPAGSEITCALRHVDNQFRVEVDNVAPDFSEEDKVRCFERLWRKDKARSGKGLGLGLTLAKALSQNLEYTIECSIPEKGKVRFILQGLRKPNPAEASKAT